MFMKIFNYRTFSFPVGFISAILGFVSIVTKYNNLLFLLLGILLLAFGLYLLDTAINHYKALIRFGDKIVAKISGVRLEVSDPAFARIQSAVGNVKIFNVLAQGLDPVLGQEREFTSSNLFQNPILDFSKPVDVYINHNDRNDYYLDVRKLAFREEQIAFSETGKYKSADGKNYSKIN